MDNLYLPAQREPTTLSGRYLKAVERHGLHPDQEQKQAIHELDRLWTELTTRPQARWKLWQARPKVKGVYLWGGVGRGKTWLMDFFYDTLPLRKKRRLHFHHFMEDVHRRLAEVKRTANPLKQVARDLSFEMRLLCVDEFNVIDIGDAVILAGLLRSLFEMGVTLVTTSNQHPDDLYKHGIQRLSFLPAIDLLKQYSRVIELGGERDYRRDLLESVGVYHNPVDDIAELRMAEEFIRLAAGRVDVDGLIRLHGRDIPFLKRTDGMIWFEFEDLCGPTRGQSDYTEIARRHHTLFLSNVPRMDGSRDDRVRRFIFLIDVLYDRRVKLVISSNFEPERLYCGERLAFEFKRTVSRLHEMRTHAYLTCAHLP